MGVCCFCCSIKDTELVAQPSYYYYPREPEEHVPLSSNPGVASSFSGPLLVDTNLDTSSPDTYRPPPAPIPFDFTLGSTQTPPVAQVIHGDKNNASLPATDSDSIQEPITVDNRETSAKLEEVKESESNVQTDLESNSTKDPEIEHAKLGKRISLAEEEEDCPICLEGDVITASLLISIAANINEVLSLQSMMQRIQNLLQNVTIIFTLHAFWNGRKEVKLARFVIRLWFSILNSRHQLRSSKVFEKQS
ncbi:hypothetical protein Lal_00041421 [Lupinus albus]|nr:hypothetical protein Lal_00041421 [Lupinus albus]